MARCDSSGAAPLESDRIMSEVSGVRSRASTTYSRSEVISAVRLAAASPVRPSRVTRFAATTVRRAGVSSFGLAASRSRETLVARTTVPVRS